MAETTKSNSFDVSAMIGEFTEHVTNSFLESSNHSKDNLKDIRTFEMQSLEKDLQAYRNILDNAKSSEDIEFASTCIDKIEEKIHRVSESAAEHDLKNNGSIKEVVTAVLSVTLPCITGNADKIAKAVKDVMKKA